MLVLTRRVGEVIMINDDIKIHVIGVKGSQVKVGIEAPTDIAVHREEIYNRIKEEEVAKKLEEEKKNDTK